MSQSHSAVSEREIPVRHLTYRPEHPKIVRIITRMNIGGPAIHTLLLTREMADKGYRTVLVAGHCEPEDGDMSYLIRAQDDVRWIPELSRSVRPWRNLQALWRLWRLLRRERPDIVHTHTAMAGCLGRVAAVLSGVPIVIHTYHGNSLQGYFSCVESWIFRLIEQALARITDVLCVVSSQQSLELSTRFQVAPAQKFRVVPLGLDLEDYFGLHPPSGTGPLTVGWFGRMVPVKNVRLLAATIAETLRHSPDICFLIAGDGPDRYLLDGVLRTFGNCVEWLGWLKEILPALARCDVLLQTSRNEGTPVALIQGLAAARPFVSTPVGGVVDMVSGTRRQDRGAGWHENAVLVEPDANAASEVLTTLAKDRTLVSRMGLAGRAFAAQRYRKERLVADIDFFYRELLNRRTKA